MRPAGRRAAVISNANRLVPMPSDHGGRLENFQCVAHAGHQAIETSEHQPIDITEDKALRRLASRQLCSGADERLGSGESEKGHFQTNAVKH